jgi:hypothetical protein
MAKRYGKLPSELLRTADSFDIMILDVATTYEAYQHAKASGKTTDFMNQSELVKYYESVRGTSVTDKKHQTSN